MSVRRHLASIYSRGVHDLIPDERVVAEIDASDMTLLVHIVEEIESRGWHSCGRASQIRASHRKHVDGFHEAVRVVDVVDGNGAIVVGRINKLPIHRGLANSEDEVLLHIGLNAVRCANSNWVAPAGAQRWRSGDCRSPISIGGEENSFRQHTRL